MNSILLFVVLIIFMSCGAKPMEEPDKKKKAEIDAVYGITDQEKAGEDELLTLLENNKKKKKEQDASDAQEGETESVETDAMAQSAATPTDAMTKRVNELQKELIEKNQIIADLMNENERLNEKITELSKQKPKVVYQKASAETGVYDEDYSEGLNQFKARKYTQAIERFEQLITRNPQHSLADNAQYWIGECFYALKKYNEAILSFEKVFTYAQSNKNDDAQFKIGLSHFMAKNLSGAKLEFQRFIDRYPKNRNIERARSLLNSI